MNHADQAEHTAPQVQGASVAGAPQKSPPSEQLNVQAMLDTSARVAGGIYIYLAVWVVIAVASGLARQQPAFVLCSSAWLGGLAVVRAVLAKSFERLVAADAKLAHRTLLASVLLNGLSWGLLTAASLYLPALEPVRWAMLIVAVGLCSAGSAIMAIDRVLKVWFPLVLIIPISIATASNPTQSNLLLTGLIVVYTLYVVHTTGIVHRDYWRALKARGDLERASLTDALTQVPNRMYFDRQFAKAWAQSSENHSGLGIVLVDLDHFKSINDTYGHQAGDLVLQRVASALQRSLLRASDTVSRYGGEEFIVLLPNTDFEGVSSVVQRILKNVADEAIKIDNTIVRVTCSVGYSCTQPDQDSQPAELIKQADSALYDAKAAGRNQACCRTPHASPGNAATLH